MTKTFTALAAAATLAVAAIAAPSTADARCFGCAVGAGIFAGTVIGSAIAGGPPAYAYGPPPPRVYADEPGYDEECHTVKQRVWIDGVGWRWQKTRVCD